MAHTCHFDDIKYSCLSGDIPTVYIYCQPSKMSTELDTVPLWCRGMVLVGTSCHSPNNILGTLHQYGYSPEQGCKNCVQILILLRIPVHLVSCQVSHCVTVNHFLFFLDATRSVRRSMTSPV